MAISPYHDVARVELVAAPGGVDDPLPAGSTDAAMPDAGSVPRPGPGELLHDLEALTEDAGRLVLTDVAAVDRLRGRAQDVTARLAVAGELPTRLVVACDDPPVVMLRVLAVAQRRVTRRPCERGDALTGGWAGGSVPARCRPRR